MVLVYWLRVSIGIGSARLEHAEWRNQWSSWFFVADWSLFRFLSSLCWLWIIMLLFLIIPWFLTVMLVSLTVHNFLQIVTTFKIFWAVVLQMLNEEHYIYLDLVSSGVHLRQSRLVISNTNKAIVAGYYYFSHWLLQCISS